VDQQRHTISPASAMPERDAVVDDQAMAWILLLISGAATAEDARALHAWRGQSPQHRRAYAEAALMWEVLGPAAGEVAHAKDVGAGPNGRMTSTPTASPRLGRRALLGGALAASVAAVAYAGSKPPLRLWPSVEELRADYRTATGEQREVTPVEGVSLLLNTQTSIDIKRVASGAAEMELISGEAAVGSRGDASIRLFAAQGRVDCAGARFNVRRDGAKVRVTCLDGEIQVSCGGQALPVSRGHQLLYDSAGIQPAVAADVSDTTAWQHGQLVFRHEALARVVAEINRYRPGRIVLLDDRLGERDVVATFNIDRLDDVVENLARTFDTKVRFLAAGVVLMG
jgi:transmembrane sensor